LGLDPLVRRLRQLLSAFQASGIDVRPYKGPVLAIQLYGHYAMRQYRDLDLLVWPEQADEALRIIGNLVKPDLTMEDERDVAIGRRVRVVFQDLADHLALPQFTLTDEPPAGRLWRLPE